MTISDDITLRDPVPGDLGFVVHRQAALYAQEYGWDWRFEGMIADIAAQFIREFDPMYERCWIAERNADIIGSVFVVRQDARIAKLRMLYVEPEARGSGLGRRLVESSIEFARSKGYAQLVLWTNANLNAARHIYESVGFTLVAEEPHRSFGYDLIGQNWALDL